MFKIQKNSYRFLLLLLLLFSSNPICSHQFVSVPEIFNIIPHTGSFTGGEEVEIIGSGFTHINKVNFGNCSIRDFIIQNDHLIRVITPFHLPEIVEVTVSDDRTTSAPDDDAHFAYTQGMDSQHHASLISAVKSDNQTLQRVIFTEPNELFYVLNENNNAISKFYLEQPNDKTDIETPYKPNGFAVLGYPEGHTLYVTHAEEHCITSMDLLDDQLLDELETNIGNEIGSSPTFLALTHDGKIAYFVDCNPMQNSIKRVKDLDTSNPYIDSYVLTHPDFAFNHNEVKPVLVISPDDLYAYVTNPGSNSVLQIDLEKFSVIPIPGFKDTPHSLSLHPNGKSAFVSVVNSKFNVKISNLPYKPSPLATVQTTTLLTTSAVGSQPYGTPQTVTATITPAAPPPPIISGNVTFLVGIIPFTTLPVVGPVTSPVAIPVLPPGSYSLFADYSGDATYFGSPSPTIPYTVIKADTSTVLSVTPLSPSNFGTEVTLIAQIFRQPPSTLGSNPSGTVEFFDGVTSLGFAPLIGDTALLMTTFFTPGSHSLTAVYQEDVNFNTSTSNAVAYAINPASTTTTLTSSLNPAFIGHGVTFTASVTPASATGQVQFFDGGILIGVGNLVDGSAVLTTDLFFPTSHLITAQYLGDDYYTPSLSNSVNQVTLRAMTHTTLMIDPHPSIHGQLVTFNAQVTSNFEEPTGTVTFSIDGIALTPIPLVDGKAQSFTANLSVGRHILIATYSGDANHQPSTSLSIVLKVITVHPPHKVTVTQRVSDEPDAKIRLNVVRWKKPVKGSKPIFYLVYKSIDGRVTVEKVSNQTFTFIDPIDSKKCAVKYTIVAVDEFQNVASAKAKCQGE